MNLRPLWKTAFYKTTPREFYAYAETDEKTGEIEPESAGEIPESVISLNVDLAKPEDEES